MYTGLHSDVDVDGEMDATTLASALLAYKSTLQSLQKALAEQSRAMETLNVEISSLRRDNKEAAELHAAEVARLNGAKSECQFPTKQSYLILSLTYYVGCT
jgi:ubiquitin-protein ligase